MADVLYDPIPKGICNKLYNIIIMFIIKGSFNIKKESFTIRKLNCFLILYVFLNCYLIFPTDNSCTKKEE